MMLLLGISLTVGFYEGRRIVKSTAKALTAATTISSGKRGARHREDRLKEDPLEMAAIMNDLDPSGKRRKGGGGARALMLNPDLSQADKLILMRQHQRQKLLNRGAPLPEGVYGKPAPKEQPLDTGLEQPERAPEIK